MFCVDIQNVFSCRTEQEQLLGIEYSYRGFHSCLGNLGGIAYLHIQVERGKASQVKSAVGLVGYLRPRVSDCRTDYWLDFISAPGCMHGYTCRYYNSTIPDKLFMHGACST